MGSDLLPLVIQQKNVNNGAAQKLLESKANLLADDKGLKQYYPFKTLFYKYCDEVGKNCVGPNTSKSS
ncbi:MAG: hypothetical protein GAK29_01917 [Acinetobacter bereziniae]|uniref:Uncharacterized protein n=1 Tax=Acinetobacter bereziniae TaxID=106648 RepID=A0A833PGA1_ACIBZ|nr:MAG: hypothetical protein GAK29_01917 [Acinetobacter bereziniae]